MNLNRSPDNLPDLKRRRNRQQLPQHIRQGAAAHVVVDPWYVDAPGALTNL